MDTFGDIVEREIVEPVVAPSGGVRGNKDGRKKESRFKKTWNKREIPKNPVNGTPKTSVASTKSKAEEILSRKGELSEMEKIHLENVEKMAGMSAEEIAQEKEELLRSLDPGVLQALLRRAEAVEGNEPMGWQGGKREDVEKEEKKEKEEKEGSKEQKKVQFNNVITEHDQEEEREPEPRVIKINGADYILQDDEEDVEDEEDDHAHHNHEGGEGIDLHFPAPPVNEGDFLDDMHTKYYPDLEIEEDKLAWMRPVSDKEDLEEYSEYQESLAPSELRFDFNGKLITPRQSRQIDTNQGLHHHGDAPLAAGYTVAELAHLARSTNYSQRCIAIRTLGRILYRLNKLQYGKEISSGLYGLIDHSRIHDTLIESCDENRTRSIAVRTYATEALWLWKGQGTHIRPAI